MKKTTKIILLTLSLCSETFLMGWAQPNANPAPAVPQHDSYAETMTYQVSPNDLTDLQRPVTSSAMFGVGPSTLHDTYLTNQLFDGVAVNLSLRRTRDMQCKWLDKDQWFDLSYASTDDKTSSSASMIAFRLRYCYAMHKFWNLRHPYHASQSSRLFVGPMLMTNFGADYNLTMAAANNPVNVHYTMNFGLSAGYQWNYSLRQRPAALRLQLQAPLLGTAFSPEYAQSYYELYMGDNSGNKHMYFTSLHRQQDLDVRLTADFPIRAIFRLMDRYNTAVRVGVNYHIETQSINHLISRYSYMQFVIGWTWQHIPYKGRTL